MRTVPRNALPRLNAWASGVYAGSLYVPASVLGRALRGVKPLKSLARPTGLEPVLPP